MRIPSAYKVYQVVFGYSQAEQGTRMAFGRAIADSLPVICEVMESGSTFPVAEYKETRYPRKLAEKFLDNFLELAFRRSRSFILKWSYTGAEIRLDRSLFSFTRKRGLDIDLPFLSGPSHSEVIIPTFGAPKNMSGELGVLRTLCTLGSIKPVFFNSTQTITYWDLLNGAECSVPTAQVIPAEHGIVLAACSRLLAG